jgi:hypothetical protein
MQKHRFYWASGALRVGNSDAQIIPIFLNRNIPFFAKALPFPTRYEGNVHSCAITWGRYGWVWLSGAMPESPAFRALRWRRFRTPPALNFPRVTALPKGTRPAPGSPPIGGSPRAVDAGDNLTCRPPSAVMRRFDSARGDLQEPLVLILQWKGSALGSHRGRFFNSGEMRLCWRIRGSDKK